LRVCKGGGKNGGKGSGGKKRRSRTHLRCGADLFTKLEFRKGLIKIISIEKQKKKNYGTKEDDSKTHNSKE